MDRVGDESASSKPKLRVIAALTSFNRRDLTLGSLEALYEAAEFAGIDVQAVLVDDASPDGTAEAVRRHFPWVEVVGGSGALFWNRGMYEAFGHALQRDADYYLWLNDDTLMRQDSLASMLRQSNALVRAHGRAVIIAGATATVGDQRITYGGRVARSRFRRFSYDLVWDRNCPVPCDVIEGNCVLIPRSIAKAIGNLDPVFEHAMGDTDYGLRARAAGYKLFVSGGVVGYCQDNSLSNTYFDASLPIKKRWQLMLSRKGLPVRSWLHFSRRHGGIMWPIYFGWPYAKLLISGLLGLVRRQAAL